MIGRRNHQAGYVILLVASIDVAPALVWLPCPHKELLPVDFWESLALSEVLKRYYDRIWSRLVLEVLPMRLLRRLGLDT